MLTTLILCLVLFLFFHSSLAIQITTEAIYQKFVVIKILSIINATSGFILMPSLLAQSVENNN